MLDCDSLHRSDEIKDSASVHDIDFGSFRPDGQTPTCGWNFLEGDRIYLSTEIRSPDARRLEGMSENSGGDHLLVAIGSSLFSASINQTALIVNILSRMTTIVPHAIGLNFGNDSAIQENTGVRKDPCRSKQKGNRSEDPSRAESLRKTWKPATKHWTEADDHWTFKCQDRNDI
jgi:hypothetical protein